jgi:hypothetical protein
MSDDQQIEPTLEQLAEHPVMIVVFTTGKKARTS